MISFKRGGELCPYAKKGGLICRLKGDGCPLQDSEFTSKIEKYLFTPRLSSYVFAPLIDFASVHGLKKIDVLAGLFCLLPHSTQRIYRVVRFFYAFFKADQSHQLWMTDRLCRDIKGMRAKFSRKLRDRE